MNATTTGDGARLIALDKLMLSDLNVRKTARDAHIAGLADDIAAKGLKQNLVVVPLPDDVVGAGDLFEVIAGGRRYQAMQLLVRDGRMDADAPVLCLVESRDEARETSLSENLQKVAMNPADEFEAYAAIIAQGNGPESERIAACAKRFGKTVSHVEGRLRLADLAPEILDALRADKMTLASAKAYAAVSDHKLQLRVFKEQEKRTWGEKHDARTVREAVRGTTRSIDCVEMKYVGRDVYVAAGGRIEGEMFMGTQAGERVLDCSLLDKLVAEKAGEQLAAQAKRDGYGSGMFVKGAGWSWRWPKAPKDFKQPDWGDDPTKAQKKKSIAIYNLSADGKSLNRVGRFKPINEPGKNSSHRAATPEEIAAQRREEEINRLAARMAVPKFAGTPFEGKAYWPRGGWFGPVEQDRNGDGYLIAVQIAVSEEEIAAKIPAATAEYDARIAAKAAEEAAAAQAKTDSDAAALDPEPGNVVEQIAALDDEEEALDDAAEAEAA